MLALVEVFDDFFNQVPRRRYEQDQERRGDCDGVLHVGRNYESSEEKSGGKREGHVLHSCSPVALAMVARIVSSA